MSNKYQTRERVYCKNCKWYKHRKVASRCLVETNMYINWRGVVYKKHPDWKNYNRECKDYKEGDNEEI